MFFFFFNLILVNEVKIKLKKIILKKTMDLHYKGKISYRTIKRQQCYFLISRQNIYSFNEFDLKRTIKWNYIITMGTSFNIFVLQSLLTTNYNLFIVV